MTIIDTLDAKIIALLRPDGRLSNVEIARRLGIAEGTVRKRIDRLVREQVIQIGAWADPLKIGYQDYINMELQVSLAHLERVAERLAKLPEIFFLGLCTGRANIFAGCCFRSNDHFFEFMTKELGRIPGIQGIATSNVTKILKREHSFPALPLPSAERGAIAGQTARHGDARNDTTGRTAGRAPRRRAGMD
ncbi:MAG: Lrp/AsnC family transcriptional regulator [Candidatus Methylomirabilales bacterium]